jgi:threonine synthase
MKAILEFTFPEDQDEHTDALNGASWKSVVWELDEWLRQRIRYENREDLQEIREKLFALRDVRDLLLE